MSQYSQEMDIMPEMTKQQQRERVKKRSVQPIQQIIHIMPQKKIINM